MFSPFMTNAAHLARYRLADVGQIAAVAGVLTAGLDKVMQISIIGLGAVDVFDGRLSIGALVAFTMLSQRVSGPLVQIVGLINEYQETALSVRMLATVMDHAPEQGASHPGVRPLITGQLTFDQATFRYAGASMPALDRVSFCVRTGQVIGVVGRSGSGKTTITRLIQGIQTAQEGAANLSGGQRQRLAIARALLPHPSLLIFDEATSALDPESEAIVQENLRDIARNRTMIIVSHRLSSRVQADAILVLDQGKVVDFAPHDALLECCAVYRQLWDQQNRHVRP